MFLFASSNDFKKTGADPRTGHVATWRDSGAQAKSEVLGGVIPRPPWIAFGTQLVGLALAGLGPPGTRMFCKV